MILVDKPRLVRFRGRSRWTSHCMSTQVGEQGTAELLAFGRSIGMQPEWLQHVGTPQEHFDLFDSRVLKALSVGAELVRPRDLITRCVRPKREAA